MSSSYHYNKSREKGPGGERQNERWRTDSNMRHFIPITTDDQVAESLAVQSPYITTKIFSVEKSKREEFGTVPRQGDFATFPIHLGSFKRSAPELRAYNPTFLAAEVPLKSLKVSDNKPLFGPGSSASFINSRSRKHLIDIQNPTAEEVARNQQIAIERGNLLNNNRLETLKTASSKYGFNLITNQTLEYEPKYPISNRKESKKILGKKY